jgi:hypothetical protein
MSIQYNKKIRRIAGTKDNPENGVSVPRWVTRETDFKQGERVKITMEKHGEEEVEDIRDKETLMEVLQVASTCGVDDLKRWFEYGETPLPIPETDNRDSKEKRMLRGFLAGISSHGLKDRPELKDALEKLNNRIDSHFKKRETWNDRVNDRERHDRKEEWEDERDGLYGNLIAVKWLLGEDKPKIQGEKEE